MNFDLIKEDPPGKVKPMTVEDVFEPGWFPSDVLAVFGHSVLPVACILPLIYITFRCEQAKATSSNREWDGMDDLKHAPWRFLDADRYDLEAANMAFIIYGVTLASVCLIELMFHYTQMDFRPRVRNLPVNKFAYMKGYTWTFAEIKRGGSQLWLMLARYYLQRFIVNLMKLFMFMHVAYAALMFTWGILGAVLNPNKFLCYAAAAGTLLAFATTQYVRRAARPGEPKEGAACCCVCTVFAYPYALAGTGRCRRSSRWPSPPPPTASTRSSRTRSKNPSRAASRASTSR
jgi:hypothetical protein